MVKTMFIIFDDIDYEKLNKLKKKMSEDLKTNLTWRNFILKLVEEYEKHQKVATNELRHLKELQTQ